MNKIIDTKTKNRRIFKKNMLLATQVVNKPAISPHDVKLKNRRVNLIYTGGYISFYEAPKYDRVYVLMFL